MGSKSNLIQNSASKAIRNKKRVIWCATLPFTPYWFTVFITENLLTHCETITLIICHTWRSKVHFAHFFVSLKQNVGNLLFTCMKIRQLKPWNKKKSWKVLTETSWIKSNFDFMIKIQNKYTWFNPKIGEVRIENLTFEVFLFATLKYVNAK